MGKLFRYNPAAILFAVNAVVNMLVGWGVHLSPTVTGAISGCVTAVLTIITASLTRPVGLQAIVGGATALLTVLSPFAFHLSAAAISKTGVVLSLMLAGLFHLAHVPVAQFNAGRDVITEGKRAAAGSRV